jgi:hypothetical protein
MKKLVVLLLVSLMAASAFAGLDETTNSLGIFFDTAGNNNCATQAPFAPGSAYAILSNPALPMIDGFEFGYTATAPAGQYLRTAEILPVGGLNVGVSSNGAEGSYVVGLASPLVTNGENVVLVTWSTLLFSAVTVEFKVGPTPAPGIPGVPAIVRSGVLYPLGIASGSKDIPVASINGECPVAIEQSTFGSVKSLFR